VFPDPYLDFEEDRKRTDAVLQALPGHDLRGLLEHYWSLSDITPVALRRRFIRGALQGEPKARRLLGWTPHYSLRDGLQSTIAWYKSQVARDLDQPVIG